MRPDDTTLLDAVFRACRARTYRRLRAYLHPTKGSTDPRTALDDPLFATRALRLLSRASPPTARWRPSWRSRVAARA